MDEQAAFEQLAGASTAAISDAMFRMGHKDRTMRARIKPIDPAMTVAGPAFTVQCYPGGTHACSVAMKAVEAGKVLVIDGGGFVEAVLWGEIFSRMAMVKGVRGTIVDGAVRDVEQVRALGYPLFAAGIHPGAGTGDKLGEIGIPVQCGGVVVHPDDWVFGDVLGVVVVPAAWLGEVAERCRDVLEKEAKLIADLDAKLGRPRV